MFSNKTHAPTYSLGMDEDLEETQETFRLFRLKLRVRKCNGKTICSIIVCFFVCEYKRK